MSSELSKTRIFDWKFIVALCLFASVGYVVFVGINAVRQVDDLVEANEHLSDINQKQLKISARERREASKERQRILNYTEDLAERQRKIYKYLVNHGIKLPDRLIDPIPVPTGQAPIGGDNNNGGKDKNKNKPPHNPGGGLNPPPTEEPNEELCLDLLNLEPVCISPLPQL